MRTILSIVKSELKQRLFSWIIGLIFFLMLVFQAIWYTQRSALNTSPMSNVLMNAPSIIFTETMRQWAC